MNALPKFNAVGREVYQKLEATGRDMLRAIALHLNLDETYFVAKIHNGNSILRPIHYPPISHEPKDAVRAADFKDNNFDSIVAINNSWKINTHWDHTIFPTDYPKNKRPKGNESQTLHTADEYVEIQNLYGGFLYAGGTMAFTAAYWALNYLKPDIIAFLGCDMIYDGNQTHFYGKGTADPLREDPSLRSIEAKANRFEYFAS